MICVVSSDTFWILYSKLPSSTYIEKGGCLSTWLSLLQPVFYWSRTGWRQKKPLSLAKNLPNIL